MVDPKLNFPSIPTLETNHFILRPLKIEDYESLYFAASDPKIWEQHPMPDRHTPEGFLIFWNTIISFPSSLVIVDRTTKEIVGTSSFYEYSVEKSEVTIGYTFLIRKYWGGPFNFEIKKAMLGYAFKFTDKVNFHVGSQNTRSRTALKKIGAIQVAELKIKQSDGGVAVKCVYQINKNKPLFRKAHVEDIPQIKSIMEKTFGPFPNLESLFFKWMQNKVYSVYVAEVFQNLIGVSTWAFQSDNDYSKYSCFGSQALDLLNNKRAASAVNLAVVPEFRNQKIGTGLALAHVDWVKQQKCDILYGTSWVNATDQNSSHLYEKAGFQKIAESTEFLRQQMPQGAICNICKSNECRCNSILYVADANMWSAQLKKFIF